MAARTVTTSLMARVHQVNRSRPTNLQPKVVNIDLNDDKISSKRHQTIPCNPDDGLSDAPNSENDTEKPPTKRSSLVGKSKKQVARSFMSTMKPKTGMKSSMMQTA